MLRCVAFQADLSKIISNSPLKRSLQALSTFRHSAAFQIHDVKFSPVSIKLSPANIRITWLKGE
jgi:hypothetical protein